MKAMIFAAGLGTRLKPLTNTIPKALVEVNGTPLLELVIKKLKHYGFDDIIVNVHHFADKIISFLEQNNNFGINITISDETDQLLDTGGGLKKASWFFNDGKPFLVYNVDILSNIDLKKFYDFHLDSKALASLAVRDRETSRYLLFNEENILCGWRNIKTGEEIIARDNQSTLKKLAFSGIHIIEPTIFEYIDEEGKFSITNTYLDLARDHKIACYNHDDTFWTDTGKPEDLERVNKIANQNLFI